MAASKNLYLVPHSHNLLAPDNGVLTLSGYGIQVRVDRGHLFLEDGIGTERKRIRFPRVGHGLKRLVVIGSDGMVSLAALRWLSDQDAAFVMLERDGKVLATTGPVRPSDARLRRAQAMALQSGIALQITRELISRKVAGQENVARNKLLDVQTADRIAFFREAIPTAKSIPMLLHLESHAAAIYWAAWRDLPITFPKADLPKVPDHWRTFGTRKSLLSGSQRLAGSPANAMLNYLFAVVESETCVAISALGLDPGLGFFHADTAARDSLACDVMEPIRPLVESYLLDWITRERIKKEWFFEQSNGNCRLMGSLAVQLSKTGPMWARAVAPIAEYVARTLWTRSRTGESNPATRLTQRHKREAKGRPSFASPIATPRRENICRGCGKQIQSQSTHCSDCAIVGAKQRLAAAAKLGRVAAHSPESRAKRSETRQRHAQACSAWDPSNQPDWLTSAIFAERIQPLLGRIPTSQIRSKIGVSRYYAGRIRHGYQPHARHWQALAELVDIWS